MLLPACMQHGMAGNLLAARHRSCSPAFSTTGTRTARARAWNTGVQPGRHVGNCSTHHAALSYQCHLSTAPAAFLLPCPSDHRLPYVIPALVQCTPAAHVLYIDIAHRDLLKLVPPLFGRLTVFDPRFPHGGHLSMQVQRATLALCHSDACSAASHW